MSENSSNSTRYRTCTGRVPGTGTYYCALLRYTLEYMFLWEITEKVRRGIGSLLLLQNFLYRSSSLSPGSIRTGPQCLLCSSHQHYRNEANFVHGGAGTYLISYIDPHLRGQTLLSSSTFYRWYFILLAE
jgi:hypothetical protein